MFVGTVSEDSPAVLAASPSDGVSVPGRKRKRQLRSRNWCFTDFTCKDLGDVFDDSETKARYICYGVEVCPETERAHHQGWVQFALAVTLASAKKRLSLPSAHFENCRGSCEENDEYCSKDGEVFRWGSFLSMGQRTDVDSIRAMLDDGSPLLDVARADFPLFCRSYRAFSVYRCLVQQTLSRSYRVVSSVILAGTTRCGKTRLAMRYNPYLIGGKQLDWFDGYEGEDVICIDDFVDDVPIDFMLRLMDGHQLRLPVKGGFTYARWTKVIITTNCFHALYCNAPVEHRQAFNARVTASHRCFDAGSAIPDHILDWSEGVDLSEMNDNQGDDIVNDNSPEASDA